MALGCRLSGLIVGEPVISSAWTEFHRWIFLCSLSCFLSSRTSALRCFFSARNLCFSAFKNLLSICFWSLRIKTFSSVQHTLSNRTGVQLPSTTQILVLPGMFHGTLNEKPQASTSNIPVTSSEGHISQRMEICNKSWRIAREDIQCGPDGRANSWKSN